MISRVTTCRVTIWSVITQRRKLYPALLLTASFLGGSLMASAQQIQISKDNRTVAVTTTGTVTMEADVATVHVGYTEYGADYQTAYANGSKASNAISAALASAGVAADGIQSDDQSIARVEQYETNTLTPQEKAARQFKVVQSWSVKVPAANVARVLDAAVKAGANQSGQVDWNVADADALHGRAMDNALSKARAAAEKLATGLHAQLGPLVYASNEVAERPPIPLMRAMAAPAPAMKDVKPLAISSRKVSDTATVYAVFALQ